MSDVQTPARRFSITPGDFAREYGVLTIIVILMIGLSLISDSFLTARNLLNILNQSAPLAIIACALTLVIIGGGFDLSTGAIFGVASVAAEGFAAPGVVVGYTADPDVQNGKAFAAHGMQIAAGVPLQVG